ncbi:amidohydrolase family protein [Pusillimonas sp. T2]|uniref:amidohydrolase family protein n=1 Tax=Pusillimonas sp. T2 TaxID=1548123 RepID=UPI002111FA08|nr:amidohydrolase family protein [Pusillimonas sp. T2]
MICPPGTVDCHVHVYGPDSVYPVAETRSFDVPEALPSTLRAVEGVLGVDRVVLVQPSGYGVDNRRHLEAAKEIGMPARVIVALRSTVTKAELEVMHDQGARGVRYNIGHAGAVPISEMPELAGKIADLGWHVQLHVMDDGGRAPLVEMADTLCGLPTDFVIDHVGSIKPGLGLDQPAFQALLRMLETGKCWVKLSCGYRMSALPPPYEDMVPYIKALIECRDDRLVWASDWPHVSFKGVMPNTTDLLDQMLTWVPDVETRHKIFVENPERLYQF